MTPKYTDADVQNLVKYASDAAEILNDNWNITKPALKAALKPFLPDPEEELLTEMCIAFTHIDAPDGYAMVKWEDRQKGSQNQLKNAMRLALAVVKERGLPS